MDSPTQKNMDDPLKIYGWLQNKQKIWIALNEWPTKSYGWPETNYSIYTRILRCPRKERKSDF